MKKLLFPALVAAAVSGQAMAQTPEGWFTRIEGAYLNQGSADFSGGGSFTADRAYTRLGGLNSKPDGLSVGVSASFGRSDYNFNLTPAPWGKVQERSVSLAFMGGLENGARWFVAPSVRSRYESGASANAGRSAGLFAGISWKIGETLEIGPAFGVFEGLGGDKYDAFPAILLDWQIAERWNLSTGPTLGASQGPGLSLRYDLNDDWGLTLSARGETNRFALSDSGPTPGAVGQDRSVPVVLSVSYDPNPGMSFVLFGGAEVDGSLKVESGSGATLSKSSYGTAPLVGAAFSLTF